MARIFVGGYDLEQQHVKNVETKKKNFYFSLINALAKAGNDVLCVDCEWEKNKKIPQQLVDKLAEFDPELCVVFNYSFWDLSDYVNCKIAYCDMDAVQDVSLPTNYLIRNKIDRCMFFATEEHELEVIKETFGIDDDRVKLIHIPASEDTQFDNDREKEYEFLYIGTNRVSGSYKEYRNLLAKDPTKMEIADAKKVLNGIEQNSDATIFDEYNSILSYSHLRLDNTATKKIIEESFGLKKIKMLSAISDIGLTIKGVNWNNDSMNYYPEVLKCVENFEVFDIDKYQAECSKSKFTLWFDDGPFAKGSYSRLLEAAQADTIVLAQKSPRSQDLIQTLNLPCFETEEELVELCKRFASKQNTNVYDVKKAHALIKKKYNGADFIKYIQEFSGLSFDAESREPTYLFENELGGDIQYISTIDENAAEKKNYKYVQPKVSNVGNGDRKQSRFVTLIKKALKRTALFFGYDLKNEFPKEAVKLFGFIIYERLHYTPTIDRIYFLSLPFFEIRKKNNGTSYLHLAFFTQIIENFGKLFRFLKGKKKKNKAPIYAKLRKKMQNGEKIKICLFVSRISCWIYTNLYEYLKNSGIFEPIVVVKPFMFNGHEAMVDYMNTTYGILKSRGYNLVKGYDDETGEFLNVRKVINPDVVFYTKYWLPQFQENFYINKFEDKLTFYTSYCFDIAYHPECMNFELNNKVDRYFMPTPIHKEMAKVAMNNHAENVYVVGAPKLDVFFDKSYEPKDVWKPQAKQKKRIIWAPHHSDNFPGNLYQFNSFYELTDFMFEMAEKYKDEIQIAFKPHPMLKPYLINKKWGKEAAEAYYQKWADLENGQLETGEFIDLFLTSDAMILDSISFIAEYTATNKPSLFTIGSTSRVKLNDFGAINFEVLYHTEKNLKEDIERFIVDVVINGNDTKKEERTAFVNQYLLPPNGKSSAENIYDNILDEIQNGDKK